jgi:hypothetical protein
VPKLRVRSESVTTELPVLSLWQPWATLIIVGVKTIETRSWRAPKSIIGQRIAIHATKKPPKEDQRVGEYGVHQMGDDSWAMQRINTLRYIPLPLGAVVATVRLVATLPVVELWEIHPLFSGGAGCVATTQPNAEHPPKLMVWNDGETYGHAIEDQRPHGDFTPGRWAWLLEDVQAVDPVVPFVGGQGFSKRWIPTR